MSILVSMSSISMSYCSQSSECNGDGVDELHDEFDDLFDCAVRSPGFLLEWRGADQKQSML